MFHGRENIPGYFTASRVCPCKLSFPPLHCRLDQALHHVLTETPHAQWVFHNVSLHNHTIGYLHDVKRRKVLQEIDRLSNLDPADLPADSRYLLEIYFNTLQKSTLAHQLYWLLAIKAAVTEGRRHRRRTLRFHMQQRSIEYINRQTTIPRHGMHNILTGALSSQGTPTTRTRNLPTTMVRQTAALSVLHSMEHYWSPKPTTTRTRPHPSPTMLDFRDTKRLQLD